MQFVQGPVCIGLHRSPIQLKLTERSDYLVFMLHFRAGQVFGTIFAFPCVCMHTL